MYDFSYSLNDFPWTRIPEDAYGSESWNMPGTGWFTFVPESWAACVYLCLIDVDTALRKLDLLHVFVIHRVEFDEGSVQVWYSFECDEPDVIVEPWLREIQDSFMRLQYITSLIPAQVPSREEMLQHRISSGSDLRDTVNIQDSVYE